MATLGDHQLPACLELWREPAGLGVVRLHTQARVHAKAGTRTQIHRLTTTHTHDQHTTHNHTHTRHTHTHTLTQAHTHNTHTHTRTHSHTHTRTQTHTRTHTRTHTHTHKRKRKRKNPYKPTSYARQAGDLGNAFNAAIAPSTSQFTRKDTRLPVASPPPAAEIRRPHAHASCPPLAGSAARKRNARLFRTCAWSAAAAAGHPNQGCGALPWAAAEQI